MMQELLNEEDLPMLPATMFGTDNLAVQMSVLLVITGMVSYSSLFVMDMIGRSTRFSFIFALEQVFLAAFSLLLTVMGILVHMLVQEMSVSYRVLSVSMLVSHAVLGILYLLAKVKQMNELADRWRVNNGSPPTNRIQSYRRAPARNDDVMDVDVTRRGSYTYRFVNPGANFDNEIMIPPNISLTPNMIPSASGIPSYIEPFRAIQSSEPIATSSNVEFAEPVTTTKGSTITEPFESLPSSGLQTSTEPTDLSSSITREPSTRLFRVNPETFRSAVKDTLEPVSTQSSESFADKSKPLPPISRASSTTSDPDPIPSTSRQNIMSSSMHKRNSAPIPCTSRQMDMEPCVYYKNGDDYVDMSRFK